MQAFMRFFYIITYFNWELGFNPSFLQNRHLFICSPFSFSVHNSERLGEDYPILKTLFSFIGNFFLPEALLTGKSEPTLQIARRIREKLNIDAEVILGAV